jgi:ABC-type glycerol-3-phosphate transport system substrate-binding protein
MRGQERFTRRTSGRILAAATAAVLVACGGPAGPAGPKGGTGAKGQPGAQGPAGKTPVVLQYIAPHLSGSVEMEKDTAQFKAFNQEFPHVTVELTPATPWAAVREKFITQAAAGTPAHLMQHWDNWIGLARGGIILELTDFFRVEKINPSGVFLDQSVHQFGWQGRMFGFPVSVSSEQLMYNKALFAEEGLPYPPTDNEDKSWTMEKFLEVAQKLTKPDGSQFGMLNKHGSFYCRGTWFGHAIWDDQQRKVMVSHPLWIQGQQFWMDLVHKYHVIPTPAQAGALTGGVANAFVAGKAAMAYTCCPHNNLKDVREVFPAGMATLPFSGWGTTGFTLHPGKNISGGINTHALHVAKGIKPEEQEAIFALFKWYMASPNHAGMMPPSNSHMIAPYKDPAYSRIPLEEFKALTGVDGSAAVLTTKYVAFPRDTAGMGKYLEFLDADKIVQEDYAKAEANEMSARDLAARAQKVFEDAKIGTQGL